MATASQAATSSAASDSESDYEQMDEEEGEDYYNDDYYGQYDMDVMDGDPEQQQREDPEYFEFHLMKVEDVEQLLNKNVEALCTASNVSAVR